MGQAFVDSVNTGNMPNIEHAWDYIKSNQNEKIINTLLQDFKR